jgi:hypothetical protein
MNGFNKNKLFFARNNLGIFHTIEFIRCCKVIIDKLTLFVVRLTSNVTVRQPPLPAVEPQVDNTPSRLFLTHFGFFEIFMRTRLHAFSFFLLSLSLSLSLSYC